MQHRDDLHLIDDLQPPEVRDGLRFRSRERTVESNPIRQAILKAMEAYQKSEAWERLKHEPLLYLPLGDFATDLAPFLAASLEDLLGFAPAPSGD